MSKLFYKALGKKEEWPNITDVIASSLTYEDALLVPQISNIKSRVDVNTKVQLGPFTLTKPIISAPMDTVTGEAMARELAKLGAIGTIPKGKLEEVLIMCKKFEEENIPAIYAVSLKNGFEEAKKIKRAGGKAIQVDVANGGMKQAIELAVTIQNKLKLFVIAGNIVTYEQAKEYRKQGLKIAKVGVGPGGTCITRIVAGTGFPQLSAIFETSSAGLPIIADGGIKTGGHFAKAIAAGADFVMIGSIFGGTDEAPGKVKNGKKVTRGQASESYMKDNGVLLGEFRAAEGISVEVPLKGPVKNVIEDLMGGLRSAMSYAGAKDIKDFQKKAVFSLVSSSVSNESNPWLASL